MCYIYKAVLFRNSFFGWLELELAHNVSISLVVLIVCLISV